ncbi:MAG: four helix bundle protein [Phycisphaerales bacterium]
MVVYKRAQTAAMKLFELSKEFPKDERYSLTDQVRRSSRSVVVNFAEAWRKRRYEAAFVSKLSDSETEAVETQEWIIFAVKCNYLKRAEAEQLFNEYEAMIKTLVGMIDNAEKWTIKPK